MEPGTVANTSATVQIVSFTGTFAAGDIISYKIDGAGYGGVSLSAADAAFLNDGTGATTASGSALVAGTHANGDTQAIGTTSHLISDVAVAVAVSADKTITITTVPGASATEAGAVFVVSNVTVSRGIHAPTTATDITSRTLASNALGGLDRAVEGVNSTRAQLGASMSRLECAADNLQNVSQNSSAARSRVLDADYASETTELARTQIIQQASTAMLSQANQSQQSVLSLLK